MRLENGMGTVSKLSGKRRNPYMVKIPVGYEEDEITGKKVQCYKVVGYTPTLRLGRQLLRDYHRKQRFDPDMTFIEVYERFKINVPSSLIKSHNASFKACESIHYRVFSSLDVDDLQEVIDCCGKNYPTLRKIRLLFSQMYDYAIQNGICSIDYSEGINIRKYKDRNPRSMIRNKMDKKDVEILWAKRNSRYYQMILFMIYTGVRVGEMLNLKKEDINIEKCYFKVTKSKTSSGIRVVPIASKIMPFVIEWYNLQNDSDYLFNTIDNQPFKYRNYYDSYFTPLMKDCGMNYTPHFCRHTFISLMSEADVSPIIIKKIVGHSSVMSITERVYTHFEIQEMLDAVNKI